MYQSLLHCRLVILHEMGLQWHKVYVQTKDNNASFSLQFGLDSHLHLFGGVGNTVFDNLVTFQNNQIQSLPTSCSG